MELLIEAAVRATALAGACALVLFVARVKAPAVLHALWAGVVVAMVLLPSWIVWGPEARVPLLSPRTAAAAVIPASRLGSNGTSLQSQTVSAASPRSSTAPDVEWRAPGWQTGALVIYGVVAIVLFARLVLGTLRARTLVKRSSACAGHLTSAACASPVTVGWLRPVIILPETWRDWPVQKLDAVLTHEQEHVRRRHPFVQWLALFNRALFWFHPVAWWLPRHLSLLAERTCDDAVLACGHDPRDYSRYLLETASAIPAGGRVTLAGVFMPGHQVSQRIQRILVEGPAPALALWRATAIAAVCVVTGISSLIATPVRAASQTSAASRLIIRPVQPRAIDPESQRPQPVSLDWVEGDEWAFEVQPIASSAELAEYGRLANARERDAFIDRFWAQRDTSPGTAANEFRDEYERRIAFGRRTFASSSGMGFDTDRGRMHLMLGAPDSIETENLPFDRIEIWRYASIAGLGNDVRIRFSRSRDQYCGLRLVSPAPAHTHGVVGLYAFGLSAIAIPVEARTVSGVQYELRSRSGERIDDGSIGSMDAGTDGALASHMPQEWFAGGFGCTHSLPPDRYTLTTAVRRLTGEFVRDSVTFDVD